ncbi:hypothetical protein OEZ85_009390 [Tetradesmus obliquus]|uniref:Uncharacterized protein n=1 Tax=Tetradesmus obliquus TaxID=3088 RepID=A0ABY8U948_TETOB|nr:hypothetical protein OEZ85_009390 [Tetradesmus obliquus]
MVLLDLTVHQEQIISSSSEPLSHMQQLELLVDEWVTLSTLALILHPVPVYMACTINHTTQLPCAVPEGHHDRVVRRMQLTPQQAQHFAAVLEEIGRLDEAVMSQGGQLARNAACPSTVVLAAQAERGAAAAAAAAAGGSRGATAKSNSSSGDGSNAPSLSPAAAAAAQSDASSGDGLTAEASDVSAAAAVDDSLAPPAAESLLQRYVGRLPLHGMLLLVFNCNTLTRLQLAKCIVASYPFLPATGAIAASAAKLHHQQQRHKQLQQQQLLDAQHQQAPDAELKAAAAAAESVAS